MIGTILMLSGGLLLLLGIVIFYTSNKTPHPETSKKTELTTYEINKKKGDDFEKFIVQKFNKEYFNIKEWAGDKYVNGVYAETTLNPDLRIEFKIGTTSEEFSVECKWRNNATSGVLNFATANQIKRYKKFEHEQKHSVFIAIGLGGEPSSPEKLYIIPLQDIDSGKIPLNDLEHYSKNPEKDFYYDAKLNQLR